MVHKFCTDKDFKCLYIIKYRIWRSDMGLIRSLFLLFLSLGRQNVLVTFPWCSLMGILCKYATISILMTLSKNSQHVSWGKKGVCLKGHPTVVQEMSCCWECSMKSDLDGKMGRNRAQRVKYDDSETKGRKIAKPWFVWFAGTEIYFR